MGISYIVQGSIFPNLYGLSTPFSHFESPFDLLTRISTLITGVNWAVLGRAMSTRKPLVSYMENLNRDYRIILSNSDITTVFCCAKKSIKWS